MYFTNTWFTAVLISVTFVAGDDNICEFSNKVKDFMRENNERLASLAAKAKELKINYEKPSVAVNLTIASDRYKTGVLRFKDSCHALSQEKHPNLELRNRLDYAIKVADDALNVTSQAQMDVHEVLTAIADFFKLSVRQARFLESALEFKNASGYGYQEWLGAYEKTLEKSPLDFNLAVAMTAGTLKVDQSQIQQIEKVQEKNGSSIEECKNCLEQLEQNVKQITLRICSIGKKSDGDVEDC